MTRNENAKFSNDGKYRFWLRRFLSDAEKEKPICVFVMLNPSVANAKNDDPTVRKCRQFAQNWRFGNSNFGSLEIVNLFAFVSFDPEKIRRGGAKMIGKNNDDWILRTCKKADLVVAAWGENGEIQNRGKFVLNLLKRNGIKPKVLGINQNGEPKHPLRLKNDLKPKPLSEFNFSK